MLAYILFTKNNLNFTAFDLLYAFFIYYGKLDFSDNIIEFERLDYRYSEKDKPTMMVLTTM